MQTKSFKDLVVWQKSMELAKAVYKLSQQLPKSENFALTSQIQRATVSIPSNIAEGYARNNLKEYIQFLSIANGSAAELETQLIIVKEIYPKTDTQHAFGLLEETQKNVECND